MADHTHTRAMYAKVEIAFVAPGREQEVRDAILDGIDHLFEHGLTDLVEGADSRVDFYQGIQWADDE